HSIQIYPFDGLWLASCMFVGKMNSKATVTPILFAVLLGCVVFLACERRCDERREQKQDYLDIVPEELVR
ncbi:hypothetical protein U9M48_025234, partial [Paspalum notatum var. saurae]